MDVREHGGLFCRRACASGIGAVGRDMHKWRDETGLTAGRGVDSNRDRVYLFASWCFVEHVSLPLTHDEVA